jgi:ribonucleoside-diphosphate reductase alpha chain
VGLGFTGLGDALIMLGLRYDTEEARAMGAKIAEVMRDEAYAASVELAAEKGAFPLLDMERYLAAPRFASRLPENLKRDMRKHGVRNNLYRRAHRHDLAAFADSTATASAATPAGFTSTGASDGSRKVYDVEDHAWRLYKHLGGDVEKLPPQFVTALELSALDHMQMVAAVAPFVDSAISKTVNVPEDYPYDQFEGLYLAAWKAGLKGITTYCPNKVLGAYCQSRSQGANPSDSCFDTDRAPPGATRSRHRPCWPDGGLRRNPSGPISRVALR